MPLTYTGRRVTRDGLEVPSLTDIAVGLFRQPRFAGQTQRWWSVGDHSLFMDELAKREKDDNRRRLLRLAVLLHDAHEAITADVPTDIKGDELRTTQDILDSRIFGRFFPGGARAYWSEWSAEVKRLDRQALLAEAQVVGPPVPRARIRELFGQEDAPVQFLELLLDKSHLLPKATLVYGAPPFEYHQERHPGVKEYLYRLETLL